MLICNGTVIDPANERHGSFDVLLADGRVAEVAPPGSVASDGVELDAQGCWVVPGLIDMHVHLREPGYEYKETVRTGTEAAVAGGITAVACMANTNPVNDSGAVTEYILGRARVAQQARVYPIGAVSVGLLGKELAEVGEMHRAGIVAISDDGAPLADSALMRRALEYGTMFGLPVIAHEEDPGLSRGGVMNEGPTAFRLGLAGLPGAAEEVMVARDIALAERAGGHLHIAHVSTAGSVDLIRTAKAKGLAVTAEVTPHHLALSEEAVGEYDTNAKMVPPLRGKEDVAALIEGLRDGTIDAIASDHAPHHRDEKEVEFPAALNGVVGLETMLSVALHVMRKAQLPVETVLRALSTHPARILGVEGGSLSCGAPADITLIDPELSWEVDPCEFRSKARNTPFAGWSLRGRATATIVGGRVVWRLAVGHADAPIKRGRRR